MISKTLTTSDTTSDPSVFSKGNAQMLIQGKGGATGHVKLTASNATITVPIFEGQMPRNTAKVIVVSDTTINFQFEWFPGPDCPTGATVEVYLGQQ